MRKLKVGFFLFIVLFLFSLCFMGKGEVNADLRVALPSSSHIFGCDTLGRDLFQRVCFGTVLSISISTFVSTASVYVILLNSELYI